MINGVCVLDGDVKGTIYFEQISEKCAVKITGEVTGVSSGWYGFHIHDFGDNTNGCKTAGLHLYPHKTDLGARTDDNRLLGDLGNKCASGDGPTAIKICDLHITLFGRDSIIGRTLVVHADPVDVGKGEHELSRTTCNAGARIGCGIIALAKVQKKL